MKPCFLFFLFLIAPLAFAEDVSVVVPSLVQVFPSSNVLYLNENRESEFRLTIVSRSDSDMQVFAQPDASLQPFMYGVVEQETLLRAKESVVWKWKVAIPGDLNFEGVEGNVVVDVEAGQQQVQVPLQLRPEPDFLYYFFIALIVLFGIVAWKWLK